MEREMHFDVVPWKVYPRTFLNTVFVVFSFTEVQISNELLHRVQQFLLDSFSLEQELAPEDFKIGFAVENQSLGLSFFFSNSYIGVKYFKEDYVSFSGTMMPLVYRLLVFVKTALSRSSIDSLQIRKINVWESKAGSESAENERLVNGILSPELIQVSTPENEYETLKTPRALKGVTEGVGFEIHYGIRDLDLSSGNAIGLVLDETVTLNNQLELPSVEEELKRINGILFNIFHWSVSPNTIAYMAKES